MNQKKKLLGSSLTPFCRYEQLIGKYNRQLYWYLAPLIDILIQVYCNVPIYINYKDITIYANNKQYINSTTISQNDIKNIVNKHLQNTIYPKTFFNIQLCKIIRKREHKLTKIHKNKQIKNQQKNRIVLSKYLHRNNVGIQNDNLSSLIYDQYDKHHYYDYYGSHMDISQHNIYQFQDSSDQYQQPQQITHHYSSLEFQNFNFNEYHQIINLIIDFTQNDQYYIYQLDNQYGNQQNNQYQIRQADKKQQSKMDELNQRNRIFYGTIVSPFKKPYELRNQITPLVNAHKKINDARDWQQFYGKIKEYTNRCQKQRKKLQQKQLRRYTMRQRDQLIQRKRTVRQKARNLLQKIENDNQRYEARKYQSIPKQLKF